MKRPITGVAVFLAVILGSPALAENTVRNAADWESGNDYIGNGVYITYDLVDQEEVVNEGMFAFSFVHPNSKKRDDVLQPSVGYVNCKEREMEMYFVAEEDAYPTTEEAGEVLQSIVIAFCDGHKKAFGESPYYQ